ncbi:MAG: hypothetical protein AAFU60_02115 [Bacteroidota bacterium]
MKQLLPLFAMILFATSSFGQQSFEQEARTIASSWATLYQMDQEQADEMYTIQLRKLNNLEAIAGFKQTDPLLYVSKLKSIELSTDVSIQKMLTKDQQKIHTQVVLDRRKRRADLARKMSAEGAAPRDIEIALYELE